MKKATSRDVAKLAGVSQATVSIILNNKDNYSFSEETRNRVFEAAYTLNYVIPSQSGALVNANSHLIAVLIPTLANPYYADLIQQIEQYANGQGYMVMFCNTSRNRDMENYYLNFFKKNLVCGIIYTFVPSFPKLVDQLALSIPVVLIGEKGDDLKIPSMELSNLKSGMLMAEHLYSLGHRDFAFITTPIAHLTLAREQRLEGFRNKLEEYGVSKRLTVLSPKSMEESDSSQSPYEFEVGAELTDQFLKKGIDATALIGVNDMTALGILYALRKNGYGIPEDFSVCGFDNIFNSSISDPPLTTVDHHLFQQGKSAVDIILNRDAEKSAPVNKIEYQPQLIQRRSTGICRRETPEAK